MLSSPVRCDIVYLSSHLWTHKSQARVVAYSAPRARRWCDLKDTLDSIQPNHLRNQEGFANRKLIRPTLTRAEHNHAQATMSHNHVTP